MDNLIRLYEKITINDKYLIQADKILLKEMHTNPNFFLYSLNIVQNNKISQKIRQFILSIMKHFLQYYWNSVYISQKLKQQILNSLIKTIIVMKKEDSMSDTVGEILGIIQNQKDEISLLSDFWDQYILYYEQVNCLEHYLTVIIYYLKNSSQRTLYSIELLLQFLTKIFVRQDLTIEHREMIMTINYLSLLNLNQQENLSQLELIRAIQPSFQDWIKFQQMILSATEDSYIKCQIYVSKSLSILFRDYKSFAGEIIEKTFQHIFKFFNYICFKYIEEDVLQEVSSKKQQQLEYMIQENFFFISNQQEVVNAQIELFNSLCYFTDFGDNFDFILYPIIWNLAHLVMMSHQEVEVWQYDKTQYIIDSSLDLLDFNLQIAAKECINNFIEKFDQKAIDVLKNIIDHFLFDKSQNDQFIKKQYNDLVTPFKFLKINLKKLPQKPEKIFYKNQNQQIWKRKEAALNLLGHFLKDISGQNQTQQQSNENNYLNVLVDLLNNSSSIILIGRCIYIISQMRYLYDLEQKNFIKVYQCVLQHLEKQKPLCIQLCASRTTTVLSYKISKEKMQKQISQLLSNDITNAFKSVVQLLNLKAQDVNLLILDNILSFYDIQPDIIQQFTDKNLLQQYMYIFSNLDNTIMINSLIIDILKRILKCHNKGEILLNIIFQYFTRLMIKYKNTIDENEHIANVFDLIIFANEQDIQMNNVFKITHCTKQLILKCAEPRVINKVTILFKNLLIKKNFNQKYQSQLDQFIQELLIDQLSLKQDESRSTYCGNLALIYTQENKDKLNAQFIEAVVRKLNKCSLPSTNQGFIIFFAYLFQQDFRKMEQIFQQLQIDTKFGFKILLDHWLLHQPKFIGPYTKSLTISLLMTFLQKGNIQTQNMYVIGLKPSHNKRSPELKLPIKIISILIEIAQHEEFNEKQKKNKLLDTEQRTAKYIEECMQQNQRLETSFDEEDSDVNSMDVELNIDSDDEEMQLKSKNDGGFGAVETGSQSYLSGLMGFDDFDNNEYDESTENDLKFLHVKKMNIIEDLKLFLKNFIKTQSKTYSQNLDKQIQLYIVKICNQNYQQNSNFLYIIIQHNEQQKGILQYRCRVFKCNLKRIFFNKTQKHTMKMFLKLFNKI